MSIRASVWIAMTGLCFLFPLTGVIVFIPLWLLAIGFLIYCGIQTDRDSIHFERTLLRRNVIL